FAVVPPLLGYAERGNPPIHGDRAGRAPAVPPAVVEILLPRGDSGFPTSLAGPREPPEAPGRPWLPSFPIDEALPADPRSDAELRRRPAPCAGRLHRSSAIDP